MFYIEISENQFNFLTDFFYLYGKLKSWSDLVKEYNLNHKLCFKWSQLIPTLPRSWKKVIEDDKGNYRNIVILNHHLLRNNHIYSLEKINAKELYFLSSYHLRKNTLRIFFLIFQSNGEMYTFYLDW